MREELIISNAGVDRNSNQTLVTRTPDLIKSLVTFALRQLDGLSLLTPSASLAGRSASPAERSSHQSHPLRFPKQKHNAPTKSNIKKKKQAILKTVFLFDKVCYEDDEDNGEVADYKHAIKEDMILLKGEFHLECDADKESIWSELRKVCL